MNKKLSDSHKNNICVGIKKFFSNGGRSGNLKYVTTEEKRLALNNSVNKYNRKVRFLVLQHYSSPVPFCACCDEKEYQFLTIDHVDNDGAEHRKLIGLRGRGGNIYHWLKRNGFPPGFQVLCYNCNCSKGFYGECPHKVDNI